MILTRLTNMLYRCSSNQPFFPPTDLYNEGWMLRLVLDWFASRGDGIADHILRVPSGCRWYSEALMESPFKPRKRGDPLGEGYTHADGVIGHFEIGGSGDGDLVLRPDATHFVVIEAKMFSGLAKRTTHARYFDQAARNVACVAHALSCPHGIHPDSFTALSFVVVIPEVKLRCAGFEDLLDGGSIKEKVQRRVSEYADPCKQRWFDDWFLPTLQRIGIRLMTWEEVIEDIRQADPATGEELAGFYKACLKYNGNVEMAGATQKP